jgi:hypothetical protein
VRVMERRDWVEQAERRTNTQNAAKEKMIRKWRRGLSVSEFVRLLQTGRFLLIELTL